MNNKVSPLLSSLTSLSLHNISELNSEFLSKYIANNFDDTGQSLDQDLITFQHHLKKLALRLDYKNDINRGYLMMKLIALQFINLETNGLWWKG